MIHPDIARFRTGTSEYAVAQEFPELPWKDIERIVQLVKEAPEGANASTFPRCH